MKTVELIVARADRGAIRFLLAIVGVGALISLGTVSFVVGESGPSNDSAGAASLIWITLVVAAAFVIAGLLRGSKEQDRLFHPIVAPLAYLVYALLVPLAYISITGNDIQNMPSTMLNPQTAAAMVLTVVAYCFGVGISQLGVVQRHKTPGILFYFPSVYARETSVVTRDLGRIVLMVALAAHIHEWIVAGTVSGRTYGADQLAYNVDSAIAVVGESLVGVGCLLVMRGNSLALRRPLTTFDLPLVLGVLGIGLFVLGSRAEAIAPVVLFLWFWIKSGRTIAIGKMAIGLGVLALLFLAVAQLRTHAVGSAPFPALSDLLVETSSPVYLTDNVLKVVPSERGFFAGSTYLASFQYFLPGPIGRALFGGIGGTGSLVYRDLIHFTNPGQGWGFSFPTEAYINFGFAGIAAAGLLVGFLFGRSYSWVKLRGVENRLGSYLYPLLLSYFPFGIRSDALGELKSILYPLIICIVALLISSRFVNHYQKQVALAPRTHAPRLVAK